jgi:CubicO group peptidase (beta-lactamase class C family)
MNSLRDERRRFLGCQRVVLFAFVAAPWASVCSSAEPPPAKASDTQQRLGEAVRKLRNASKLVGLAAMMTVDGKVVAAAADGERSKGSGVQLEVSDRWHVGSITKSITATMIARLIERQKLDWGTTIGESFGETTKLHDDWRGVTLEQLLTHTSGAPANFSFSTQFNRPAEGEKRVTARSQSAAAILAVKPMGEPGKTFRYSNVGFTIAAAMAEKETGTAWEDLIRQHILAPLKLEQAGFGPPQDGEKKLSQPRGHQNILSFKRVAGVLEDNTPIMGPAGSMHMTLANLCAFGREHLKGEQGGGKLLKAETFKRLHTAKLKNYAFGWVAPTENPWTKHRVIWHNGSNTMWYALLVILPEKDAVFAITSNDGDIRRAEKAAFQIVKEFAGSL